ncbi:NOP58 family protein [Candidatus Parvarchaeota archaeon]|nr:NOP58 family protein [Candidatus Parvarchaeota archaeon]
MVDQRRYLEKAKLAVKSALVKRDNLLAFTVASIEDINKTANLLFERMSEWYGVYFPELKISEPQKFCEFVVAFDKNEPSESALRPIVGERAVEFAQKAKSSMGIQLEKPDLDEIQALARQILGLYSLREELETYQQSLVSTLAPNVSYLCEPALAAKLVASAGGVDKLALMPSSTVQVLGAEKALFKHLRSGSAPPKHGIIFQHALISSSPRWSRGKIARALATKIAIAAKADSFTKNFIAEKLKETFEARAKAVLAQKPPEPKPQQQAAQGSKPMGGGFSRGGGFGGNRFGQNRGPGQGGRDGGQGKGGFGKGKPGFKRRW